MRHHVIQFLVGEVGKTPVDIGAQNRQDARDLYANQYNSEGDSSWSTDAVFNGVED